MRHRVIASTVIDAVKGDSGLYEPCLRLAIALGPLYSLASIRARTLIHRVVAQLLDCDLIYGWLGARATHWYDSIDDLYNWNARYWEQRALFELKLNHRQAARSFAEKALLIQRHPFTLNTHATVLTRIGLDMVEARESGGEEVFWEGIASLRDSRGLGDGHREHPYITFFTRALELARLQGTANDDRQKLIREWNRWVTKAQDAPVFKHATNFNRLRGYIEDWLRLAVR